MTEIWISAAGLCGATIIGAILGFFIKCSNAMADNLSFSIGMTM